MIKILINDNVLYHLNTTWRNSYMGVSKNRGIYPQIIHLFIGFSIIFTIHFGVPLFLETAIYSYWFNDRSPTGWEKPITSTNLPTKNVLNLLNCLCSTNTFMNFLTKDPHIFTKIVESHRNIPFASPCIHPPADLFFDFGAFLIREVFQHNAHRLWNGHIKHCAVTTSRGGRN